MTEWKEGDSASFTKTITDADVVLFAALSGDINPVHLNEEFAAKTRFGRRIAHGMLIAGMVSAVLGTKMPGTGAIYAGQTIRFTRPVYLGDTITATATIISYDRDRGKMVLETICRNQDGEIVLSGEADVRYKPDAAMKSISMLAKAA